MQFEQIAMKADKNFKILKPMMEEGSPWSEDTVHAKGVMPTYRREGEFQAIENTARLKFNYDMIPGKEFELLYYDDGPNFLDGYTVGDMSHMGVHVPDIDDFRTYLADKGFRLVQEVITVAHSNVPADRHYHYAIFKHPKQFHWKLIERLDLPDWDVARTEMERRYDCGIF